jgi:hypothetical protein
VNLFLHALKAKSSTIDNERNKSLANAYFILMQQKKIASLTQKSNSGGDESVGERNRKLMQENEFLIGGKEFLLAKIASLDETVLSLISQMSERSVRLGGQEDANEAMARRDRAQQAHDLDAGRQTEMEMEVEPQADHGMVLLDTLDTTPLEMLIQPATDEPLTQCSQFDGDQLEEESSTSSKKTTPPGEFDSCRNGPADDRRTEFEGQSEIETFEARMLKRNAIVATVGNSSEEESPFRLGGEEVEHKASGDVDLKDERGTRSRICSNAKESQSNFSPLETAPVPLRTISSGNRLNKNNWWYENKRTVRKHSLNSSMSHMEQYLTALFCLLARL